MRPLSWIVGLDAAEHCVGALRWAAWLRSRSPRAAIVGVHVVEPTRLAFAAGPEREDDAALVENLRAVAARAGVGHVLESIEIVRASNAARGLLELAEQTGASMVLGRVARSHGFSLTALGGTARRIVRELPGPVCVVPRDFGPSAQGSVRQDAPVVLALEADETCVDAARVALRVARETGREVLGIHAVAAVDPGKVMPESSIAYEPFPTTDRDIERLERAARDRFVEWFRRHDMEAVPLRVEHGSPAQVVADVAEREHASVVVCGSRRLGLASRLFTTSVGTDLAAHAARPVMIVPPGWTEPR